MWSTCSMSTGHWFDAGAAGHARPQHVGVDDRAAGRLPGQSLGLSDQRPLGLGEDVGGQLVPVTLGGEGVGRLRERVVAQVQDQHLGRQRLLGVPRRALRLATTALGAGRHVEQALPAEVLDRPDAERGVLVEVVDVVEGDRLAVVRQRLDGTERDRLALEEHVERRHEDVQVLGVQHDDQERQHHADVEQQPDALEDLERVLAQTAEQVADRLGDERAVAVGQVLLAPRRSRPRRGTGTSSR